MKQSKNNISVSPKIILYYRRMTVLILMLVLSSISGIHAQSLTPSVFPANGGSYSDANGTVSWTIGEPMTASFITANGTLTQGEQQYFTTVSILNLRAFIQGFYIGSNRMNAVMDPLTRPLECDTVTLKLAAASTPYAILHTASAILNTSGDAVFRFPVTAVGVSYYLVLSHRNCLQVWSAAPVVLNVSTSYNFSNSLSSVYGGNLSNLGDGNFALWSGDLNQNGQINLEDLSLQEAGLHGFVNGYVLFDITGDGVTDAADYSMLENNSVYDLTLMSP